MDIALGSYKSIMRKWSGKRNPSPVCNTANAVTCAGDMQDGHGQERSERQEHKDSNKQISNWS
jgi:hypothetical protein